MKKLLSAAALAVLATLLSQQASQAWYNSKFGIGLNWHYQSGGNSIGYGLIRDGQPYGADFSHSLIHTPVFPQQPPCPPPCPPAYPAPCPPSAIHYHHQPSMVTPAPAYAMPAPTYAAPAPTYAAPAPTYAAPAPTYAAPVQPAPAAPAVPHHAAPTPVPEAPPAVTSPAAAPNHHHLHPHHLLPHVHPHHAAPYNPASTTGYIRSSYGVRR